MKHIYNILSILCALCLFACTAEDETLNDGGVGYLRLTVGGSNETTTKAATLPEGYTGLQIAVEIVDAEGETIEKTDDWEEWKGESIQLKVGKYTIKAHSYGFDGKQSAMAAPYYYGSKEISIESGKELNETVTCKLANVKMSVKVSDDIKANFKSFAVSVEPKTTGACDPLTFNIDLSKSAITDTAYFPVTDLIVNYSATNKSDIKNSAKKELTGVNGNDHYILNFTLAGSVGVDDPVSVVVDPTMQTYTYTFYVSTTPTNNATVSANAWAKIAYLTATDVTVTSGTDISSLKFQYRKQSTQDWTDAAATLASETYSGKTGVLEASTTYECRMVNADESFATSPITFTTETAAELYNAGFENWYEKISGTIIQTSTWYATTQEDYQKGDYLWDTSNPGSGSFGFNPTTGSTEIKHSGNSSAKLETQYALVKLAAASLYYGRFNGLEGTSGAKIDFGQPFTSRPIALRGYFQYTPVAIDYVGDNQPANTVSKGDMDVCSIYIILSKGTYQLNNTKTETLLTEERVYDNDQFIAYGELPADQCASTNGEWKEFSIPLKYKDGKFDETPTHLIVVCSSSKYGDYFTGGKGSTLYLDDFELIYDGEPVLWDEAQK